MSRCPHCDYPVPDDRESVGARCPHCRDPLYEPALRFSRPSREGDATCVLHAGMESVSSCARCNRHLCETCRTRWSGVIICAACAERALASREASRLTADAPGRQAVAGLSMGLAAWGLGALAAWGLARFGGDSDVMTYLRFGSQVLLLGAAPLAAVGVGQSATAMRSTRQRTLGVVGLVVGALYVGALLGLGTLALWQD